MSRHPQRIPFTRNQKRRVMREIAKFKETGVVSDWLAEKAAKYEWVRYRAFPALVPSPSSAYFVDQYLTSSSEWWLKP